LDGEISQQNHQLFKDHLAKVEGLFTFGINHTIFNRFFRNDIFLIAQIISDTNLLKNL
jgi:hypothetical protein